MGPIQLTAKIFSPRWGHHDTYELTFTEDGLKVKHMARVSRATYSETGGLEWADGELVSMMKNDSVYPPDGVEDLIGHLWDAWRNNQLSDAQAQDELNAFFDYINASTAARPKTDFWNGVF